MWRSNSSCASNISPNTGWNDDGQLLSIINGFSNLILWKSEFFSLLEMKEIEFFANYTCYWMSINWMRCVCFFGPWTIFFCELLEMAIWYEFLNFYRMDMSAIEWLKWTFFIVKYWRLNFKLKYFEFFLNLKWKHREKVKIWIDFHAFILSTFSNLNSFTCFTFTEGDKIEGKNS